MMSLFKNSNFVRLFLGRLITNAGNSLYSVAAMWLVYKLGGSTFYTGLAGFLTMVPNSLQFLAGPLVERWSQKKTLVFTQIVEFFLVLLIPLMYYFGFLSVALILVVMPLVACVEQFTSPAETAVLPRILEPNQLVKGNTVFAFAYEGLNLIFSGLAGVFVVLVGAVTLYLMDSISFAAAVLLFATLKLPKKAKREVEEKSIRHIAKAYRKELVEGFRFVMGSILSKFFIGAVAANFAFGAVMAVLPAYANLRGSAEYYGFMLAAMSGGFLVGALLSSFAERFPIGKLEIVSFLLSAIFWVASVIVPSGTLSILLFGIAAVPVGATEVLISSVRQRIIPEHLLARTTSVIISISASAMPLGSLVGGALGASFGSAIVIGSSAFGLLFVAIVWFIIPDLRKLPKANEIDPQKYGLTEK